MLFGVSPEFASIIPLATFVALWLVGLLTTPHRLHQAVLSERDDARARIDALKHQKPKLRVVFNPGEQPYEYISRMDVGNPLGEWENWRQYCIGIENFGDTTVHDVLVSLVTIERPGAPTADRVPAELSQRDGGRGPFRVNPGAEGIRHVELASRTSAPPERAPDPPHEIRIAYANPDPTAGGKSLALPPGEYVFTIGVQGRDVTNVEGSHRFRVTTEDASAPLLVEPIEMAPSS